MTAGDELAGRFQAHRGQLRAVAYRMLGSASEAEDAVQEAWLRLSRVDADGIENLGSWLRTVVTRICLDLLRSRRSRREALSGPEILDQLTDSGPNPEDDVLVADAVSHALLVVLDTLEPAERVAFVLHDMFAVPFDDIAPLVQRTPATTKKLASRARRKVRGVPATSAADVARQRATVSAFLDAARVGDLPGVLAVLAPDVVRYADPAILPAGAAAELHGAKSVAEGTVLLARRAQLAELVLIDGTVGAIVAPRGRLLLALTFVVEGARIVRYDVIADPERLAQLDLAVLDGPPPAPRVG